MNVEWVYSVLIIVILLGLAGLWHRSQLSRIRHEQSIIQSRLEYQLSSSEQQMSDHKQALLAEREQVAILRQTVSELSNQNVRYETELKQKAHFFQAQLQQLNDSRALMKQEFEALAQEILEAKEKRFQAQSQQSLDALLKPMKSELKSFKDRVEKMHQVDSDQRVQLRTELQSLQSLNKEITHQAERLTLALQGQKKMQGNWGELMLENVLESSGLRQGKDYKREVSIETEEGRQRPDVVVYLPQQKHLVIDAKTSLMAYTRFVNSEDPLERAQAIKDHVLAMQDRIKELADKRYYKLNGLNSPEVVIMFVPIESAYVEALKNNETLFQQAIEQQVLVATPTTLLTALNIVRQLWRFEDQSKHSAQLADRAEKVYTKLTSFLTTMQDIGRKIDGAKVSYDRAIGQLYSGKGNLIKQASEFKDLGVSVQKELPQELVDRAGLELESPDDQPESDQR